MYGMTFTGMPFVNNTANFKSQDGSGKAKKRFMPTVFRPLTSCI